MQLILKSSKDELRRLAKEAVKKAKRRHLIVVVPEYNEATGEGKGKVRPIGKRRFKKRFLAAVAYTKRMKSMG